MNVVAALPPSNRETAAEVCNEDADQGVLCDIFRNAAMSSIMGCEHDLMPEETKEACRDEVPLHPQCGNEQCKQCRVSHHLLAIFDVAALIKSFVLHPLVQSLEFLCDAGLCVEVEARVFGDVCIDFLLDCVCDELRRRACFRRNRSGIL